MTTVFFFVHYMLCGNLCSAAVIFHSLASQTGGPLHGTTKKLHQISMPLLIMLTLHTPFCGIHKLLYVHNIILLSVDLFRSIIFVFRYGDLSIAMCIKFSP